MLTSKSTLTIVVTIACLALFFHPSVWNVAFHPFSFSFNLSSTFHASQSRIGPDKVQQSGTIAPRTHLSTSKHTWGLYAVFHDEHVAMRSLQKPSPNSCCRGGSHALFGITGLNKAGPSTKLNVQEHFRGHSKFSKGADNKSGLGAGDGVARVLHPAVGWETCSNPVMIESWGRLIECPRMGGFSWWGFFLWISFVAQALISGATKLHFLKCGTIDWPGFPKISWQIMCAR